MLLEKTKDMKVGEIVKFSPSEQSPIYQAEIIEVTDEYIKLDSWSFDNYMVFDWGVELSSFEILGE